MAFVKERRFTTRKTLSPDGEVAWYAGAMARAYKILALRPGSTYSDREDAREWAEREEAALRIVALKRRETGEQ